MSEHAEETRPTSWRWNLSALRQELGTSVTDLAEQALLTRMTLYRIERASVETVGDFDPRVLINLYRVLWKQLPVRIPSTRKTRSISLHDLLVRDDLPLPAAIPPPTPPPTPPIPGLTGVWWNTWVLRTALATQRGQAMQWPELAEAVDLHPISVTRIELGKSPGSVGYLLRADDFFREHLERPADQPLTLHEVLIVLPDLPPDPNPSGRGRS